MSASLDELDWKHNDLVEKLSGMLPKAAEVQEPTPVPKIKITDLLDSSSADKLFEFEDEGLFSQDFAGEEVLSDEEKQEK